jgi:AraC-like DNA-binding protein
VRTSRLCELPRLVARAIALLGDDAAARPARGAFSAVEHAWHLADLECEAFQVRIARLLAEPAPHLPDFDGDRAAEERAYRTRSAAAGARAFARARAATIAALGRVRGADWLRGGIQEGAGYVTLGQLPERILGHDRAHAGELAALVAALRPGDPLAGRLRAWAASIPAPPRTPCGGAARHLAASALPLAAVQRAIAGALAAGAPTTAALSRALGTTPRTLQRRLAERGLTVRCLVEEARRALAAARLRAGEDWRGAGARLGYADARAFARAFKRWTAVTPAAFQRAPAIAGPARA